MQKTKKTHIDNFVWPTKIQDPYFEDEIIFAPHRLNRPRDKRTKCPFCNLNNEYPFLVENKFPSLFPEIPEKIDNPAKGYCGIIVYDKNHEKQLEHLSIKKIIQVNKLLFENSTEYFKKFDFIIAFENRGDYFGASLEHPHGQFWAFSWIPTSQKKYWEQFKYPLNKTIDKKLQEHVFYETDNFRFTVNPFQKLPLEAFIIPKNKELDGKEGIRHLSEAIKIIREIVSEYYGFTPSNSLMAWHFPPKGDYGNYVFHLSLHIPHETMDKNKVFGGIEYLTKTFINAFVPKTVVEKLREISKKY